MTGFAVRAEAAPSFARRRGISTGDPPPNLPPSRGEESESQGEESGRADAEPPQNFQVRLPWGKAADPDH